MGHDEGQGGRGVCEMSGEGTGKALPRTVVLATDLSARCDRAADRAAWLAKRWAAELVAVNALEPGTETGEPRSGWPTPPWRATENALVVAEERLRRDLGDPGVQMTTVVQPGAPAAVVAGVATARGAGLVVTGLARDETLGRFGIGATVDELVRRLDVPVLVVKSRTRGPYRRIAVASDFSPESQPALDIVQAWFPLPSVTLFHVHRSTFAGMAGDPAAVIADHRRAAESEGHAFLARAGIVETEWSRFPLVLDHGDLGSAIHRFVHDADIDLVVAGSEARGPLMRAFLGSRAAEIVAAASCDVMIVRAPGTLAAGSASEAMDLTR